MSFIQSFTELKIWTELKNWTELNNSSELGPFGSALTYLLSALGRATTGVQTASVPTASNALSWDNVLTDFGGAVNSDGIDVAAVPGSRLSGGVVYDDDGSGNNLHPYTLTGGVKDYTFYPPHETSTAYASGLMVWAVASDGIKHFYSSSGGTSGGSAPTFPTSGTVSDNDITWTEQGLYTLSGQRIEGAATQQLLNSDSPATQTTGSLATGTYTCWIADGDTGSATVAANTAAITGGGAVTDGSPLTFEVTGAGTVDVTLAGAVTFFQLEGGSFPTSEIISAGATVTRSANNVTVLTADTKLTAAEGAGRLIVTPLASGQDLKNLLFTLGGVDDELRMFARDTTINVRFEIGGVQTIIASTYTHTVGEQFIIDFAYGSSGAGVNARAIGGADSIDADAIAAGPILGQTVSIGNRLSSNHFQATYDSVKFFNNSASASSELSDWSL